MSTTIRCSSLPSFVDCARRAAARILRPLVQSAGYTLRDVPGHVAAMVGTAVHAAGEYTLRTKLTDGTLGSDTEALDRGMQSFNDRVAEGAAWDATTASPSDAHTQIRKMTGAYRRYVAPKITPIKVEDRLSAKWYSDPEFVLSGQADNFAAEPDAIRDLKTGAIRRPNWAQYGGYLLLAGAHGHDPAHFYEDFVKRVRPSKDQPEPETVSYDPQVAIAVATEAMNRTIAQIRDFRARVQTGSAPPELAFPANPQSTLCSDKFCPARNTKFCREAMP